MKRLTLFFRILPLLALMLGAGPLYAQVEKQVEVTKSYIPEVPSASKLALQPNFVDTVKIQPEIDYTITPRILSTQLTPRTFRPATVTYWEFNRPSPFYLKGGVGYPWRSVADFYAATQNPSTGYALLYVNHRGDYAPIRNDAGRRPNASQMQNRIGAAAGTYLGRHTAEADLYYDNRLLHRYGGADPTNKELVGSRVNFGETALTLRLGDDFENEEKVNFDIQAYGRYFHDNSKAPVRLEARQIDAGAKGVLGFHWGEHRFHLQARFDGAWGAGDMDAYDNLNLWVGARYRFQTEGIEAEVGADWLHSSISTAEGKRRFNYPLPHLRFQFNLGEGAFVPFIEFDGEMERGDFRSLLQENPYTITGLALGKNTILYNLRVGAAGEVGSRFSYRIFLAMTWYENARYWFGINYPNTQGVRNFLQFGVIQARQNTPSLGGELKWRPGQDWLIEFLVRGYMHDFMGYIGDFKLAGGRPALESGLKVSYNHRRFSVGVGADLQSTRHWTNICLGADYEQSGRLQVENYHVPITVDLGCWFDYHLSRSITLFLEGENLLNQRLFDWANYPLQGIGFMAGVKMNF